MTQHFEHGDALKVHNGIIFNLYPGRPHMLISYVHDLTFCSFEHEYFTTISSPFTKHIPTLITAVGAFASSDMTYRD